MQYTVETNKQTRKGLSYFCLERKNQQKNEEYSI